MSLSKTEVVTLAPTAAVFYDRLFENKEVCSYCFTQIRDIDPFPDDKNWGSRLASHPTEYRSLADGGEPGHDCDEHDDYGVIKTYRSRTFCGECGRDGLSDDQALPPKHLVALGQNITAELDRQGVSCDFDALRDSIERSCSHRDLHGYQTEILAIATGHGVAEGRRQATLGTATD